MEQSCDLRKHGNYRRANETRGKNSRVGKLIKREEEAMFEITEEYGNSNDEVHANLVEEKTDSGKGRIINERRKQG